MDPRLSRLPGILPLDPGDWLRVDEVYAAQMAERLRLIRESEASVHALLPAAQDAARELLEAAEALLPGLGFAAQPGGWRCPDGRTVSVDRARPLLTLGQLVQEDLCILQPGPEGHVLTGAILCFPASWMLSEKLGRALPGIHRPVAGYEGRLEARVQRLFDAIRPEQPLWRGNVLTYGDPALFQPRSEGARRPADGPRPFIRSERQCLLRLPRSGAVVFTIHTYVVLRATLSEAEEAALAISQGEEA